MLKTIDTMRLIERADQLIRLEATGSPEKFAAKLGISRSTWHELKKMMIEDFHFPIVYCKYRQVYHYTEMGYFRKPEFKTLEP